MKKAKSNRGLAKGTANAPNEAQIKIEQEKKAEEERLRAIEEENKRKEEEFKKMMGDPKQQRLDILKWLNSLPLSRQFLRRPDREFSDGVLVAEIVSYYCPTVCEKRMFLTWHNSENKRSNWNTLNRKVFPQLGFQLAKSTINGIVKPWGCSKPRKCFDEQLIFTVLEKLRNALAATNPSVYDYRKAPDYSDPNIVPREIPRKTKPRPPRVNINEKPPYSKVEMMIASGLFEEEDKRKEKEAEMRLAELKSKQESQTELGPIMTMGSTADDTTVINNSGDSDIGAGKGMYPMYNTNSGDNNKELECGMNIDSEFLANIKKNISEAPITPFMEIDINICPLE